MTISHCHRFACQSWLSCGVPQGRSGHKSTRKSANRREMRATFKRPSGCSQQERRRLHAERGESRRKPADDALPRGAPARVSNPGFIPFKCIFVPSHRQHVCTRAARRAISGNRAACGSAQSTNCHVLPSRSIVPGGRTTAPFLAAPLPSLSPADTGAPPLGQAVVSRPD